jgi:hypothetical protein
MGHVRALTLTQPWAGLVAAGIKKVENRPRHMIKRDAIGTRFAIHASREIDRDVYRRIFETAPDLNEAPDPTWSPCASERTPWYRLSRITSAVIAVATLDRVVHSCVAIDLGDQRRWFFGPIGYVLRDVRALAAPVPCRGFQGFWTLPDDVEASIVEQLRG